MNIAKRGRIHHLRRRVPRRYRAIEPRETVWISLHTDSETVAPSKADRAWSQTLGKTEDELRRWEVPRKKAVKNFVAVVGNKEIANITRDDMLDFRQHWLDWIEAGVVTANSANKDLIHLGDVLKTVNTMKRLGLSANTIAARCG